MRVLIGSITLLLVLQACFSYARVIKKVKHVGHHHKAKRSLEAFGLTKTDDCADHSYCIKYSPMDCATFFVKNNCKALCGLCGRHKTVKLPMVLYYNKHKGAAKKHVVRRAAKPACAPNCSPTTSQKLFDYVGGYNHWNFQFTDKHPIQMDWSKPQPFAVPADQASNQANTQQDQQTGQAAPAADQPSYQAAPAQENYTAPTESAPAAAAYPATQNVYQPQTATPQQNYQNQQPAAAATTSAAQTNDDTTTIKLPNSALQQANQGKDVYVALVDEKKLNKPSYTLSAVQNDEPQKQKDDNPIQSFNYTPIKVKCPPGQECNYKGPNAPQVNQTFMVYCDDRFPSCGVLHSSCNDSWMQLYCPKRCNLCRPEDQQQTKPMLLDANTAQNTSTNNYQQQTQTQYGNKVYPTKITELKDESPKMESELVAPEPGTKAERARYTLHVSPKLKDGVPQTQEILIMPPNAIPGSDVKPLVILKQKVTKPMVENIEIDVPPKGTAYSDEPKVEVIEGNKHESLNVVGGQADLSQAEANLEAGKTQQAQDATPTQTTPAQTTAANATTPGNYGNWTTTAPATQAAQDTQAQYSQSQTSTYQDTQSQATQSQAAQPAQSYQDTQAQAYQTQAAQPEATQPQATQDQAQQQATQTQATQDQAQQQATQTQATQDQAQQQAAQTQATQSYAQSTAAPAPTAAPAQASAYPAQQDSQQTYTAAQACSDEPLCASYTNDMCNQNWLQNHCKSKCKLC